MNLKITKEYKFFSAKKKIDRFFFDMKICVRMSRNTAFDREDCALFFGLDRSHDFTLNRRTAWIELRATSNSHLSAVLKIPLSL